MDLFAQPVQVGAGMAVAPFAANAFLTPAVPAPSSPSHQPGHVAAQQASSSSSSSAPSALTATSVLGVAASAIALARGASAQKRAKPVRPLCLHAFENELGVQAPFGYWDPLGLSSDGDVATFKRRRTTELKHGRVAMYATMGYILPEYFRFPGYLAPTSGLKFDEVPNGLAALSKVPVQGWAQVVVFCGFYEFPTYNSTKEPGDLGWKALTASDPEALRRKRQSELANGRLAMMAIMGMMFQDGLTGSAWGDWALYTDSPLRAFENELGVQPPVGFWDPVGFTKDGDVDAFKRRRAVEIKHGRIAMLATMGYITAELVRWPGYCATGLKFSDIPNGLKALDVVPFAGWLQIVAYIYSVEASSKFAEDSRTGVPGEVGWKPPLLSGGYVDKDPELKQKKLSAEIANGRLAMMAIIGMFFQDGLTGSAWGDWANYTESPLRAFESELGVQAPVGFWDPVGFTKDGDVDAFKRRRAVEIKHGRIAMLATMGYITAELVRWPGYCATGLKFSDIPNGLKALDVVPFAGWLQIVAYIYSVEASSKFAEDSRTGVPGEVGWKPPLLSGGYVDKDPELKQKKLAAEIANGRLAMMAIIGMFFQDGLTGSAWGDWANYTESPLRAFENELGVQAPVGFWDPLGFTKDGDVPAFKRRRATELKHGRLSMFAAMGYLTPEITGKFQGYLSPSMNLKFADIPNGLGALTKVPALGWAQIVGYAGLVEISSLFEDYESPDCKPGNFGFKVITSDDPAELNKKLNAEIANGRLAMVAIMGMMFQNGTIGDTGPGMWLPGASAFENELGVQAPVGFWDPAGFTKDSDQDVFRRRRETEIKHGRVSMWACMGYIVPEYFRWPGYCSPTFGVKFDSVPNGLGALKVVPLAGWLQMILFAGMLDFAYFRADKSRGPGDFENGGVLGVPNGSGPIKDAESRTRKLNAEIANGRLAMMAIIGMFFQDGLTGSAWGDWALYTASPLRARGGARGGFDASQEVGALPPLGYWDPCGFVKDEATFKEYRGKELKHGRVAMMAIVGFLGQKFWHIPVCKDVPSGVDAATTYPGSVGLAFLFLLAGFFEMRIFADKETEPGNYGDPLKFMNWGKYDTQWRNLELSNGRLAMIGAIGTMAASWYTGLDAFQQWDAAKPAAVAFVKSTIPFAP